MRKQNIILIKMTYFRNKISYKITCTDNYIFTKYQFQAVLYLFFLTKVILTVILNQTKTIEFSKRLSTKTLYTNNDKYQIPNLKDQYRHFYGKKLERNTFLAQKNTAFNLLIAELGKKPLNNFIKKSRTFLNGELICRILYLFILFQILENNILIVLLINKK